MTILHRCSQINENIKNKQPSLFFIALYPIDKVLKKGMKNNHSSKMKHNVSYKDPYIFEEEE
jgi:hypothetical protein